MLIGKKVCLEPDEEQEKLFSRFASTARFAWNESKAFYDRKFEEEHKYATIKDLITHLQEMKHKDPAFAWLWDTPEAVTKQEIKDLVKAYSRYYECRDPENPELNKPQFKKKGKAKLSFYQRTDNIHKTDDSHIRITGIKKPVKCRGLKGIDLPENIQNPRITNDGKYWYLSYSYNTETEKTERFERDILGIDLGVKDLAVFSTGAHYRNINKDKKVKKLQKRLRHVQRMISRKYEANKETGQKGKKKYRKTKNIIKAEAEEKLIYRRIRNIRQNYLHSVVNEAVRIKPQKIIVEDLDIRGLMQKPKLARMIQEERLYEFRRILSYKCRRVGIEFETADRYYPSSQLCSQCGNRKKDLKLSDRIYRCECCGCVMDRDENAALNLEKYPASEYKMIQR